MTLAVNIAQQGSNNTTFRNRIINGGMVIDQRNAGASVAVVNAAYPVDRFRTLFSGGCTGTVQRSTTAPTGFVNSFVFTVTSGVSSTSLQQVAMLHRIEGTNSADLGWGTSNAKTITLSFWVRSSLIGTYCVNFKNAAIDRSYVATYTIDSANTWEYKTITISGDTTGTWLTTSGTGISVSWDLKSGSSFQTTAGSWVSGSYNNTSAQVDFAGTTGATFYITGVQLEAGSTASPFEYRSYGTELALCQRYFEKSVSQGTAIQTSAQATFYGNMQSSITNGTWYLTIPFKVIKRAAPTVTTYPYTTATNTGRFSDNVGTDYGAGSAAAGGIYDSQFNIQNNSGGTLAVGSGIVFGSWFASAEL